MKKLYVRNVEEWTKCIEKDYYTSRDLKAHIVDNAVVLPIRKDETSSKYMGGICNRKFEFIAGFLRFGKDELNNCGCYGVGESYSVKEKDIIFVNEEVIFGGVLVGHFGHFILESMARLWYVINNFQEKKRIVFITVLDEQKWFWDFFDLLGIEKNRILFIYTPTCFKKIVIPDEAIHSWVEYTNQYLTPYNMIKKNVPAGKFEKIYLTRSKLQQGVQTINEVYFEDFYKKKGYVVISPELFSLKEQVSFMKGAKEVAGILGSLTHLVMFCEAGTKLTALCRVDNDTLQTQCLINQANDIDCTFVDVSMNFLPAYRYEGVVNIGKTLCWREYVKNRYGDDVGMDEEECCQRYIELWMSYYRNPINFEKIKSMNAFDFLNNMYRTICGKELNRLMYENSYLSSKESLQYVAECVRQLKKYRDTKTISLWGCGKLGKNLLRVLEKECIDLDYVIDMDKSKQGEKYYGYIIKNYYDIADDVDIVLVLNPRFLEEICEIAVGKEIIDVSRW